MNKNKRTQSSTVESAEPHHGDLRKGAYLKRRAAYQTQVGSTTARAGTTVARGKDTA